MNIKLFTTNNIQKTNNIGHYSNSPISFGRINECDTFIKSVDNDGSSECLSKDEILSIINDKTNEIGRGYCHIAYNMPAHASCVLRVESDFNPLKFKNAKIKITKEEDKNLKVNIGQKVAQIELTTENGEKSQTIEVLKKQEGKPVGVTPYEVLLKNKDIKGINEYSSKEMKELHKKAIDTISKFPLSSYEKLVDTLQQASKCNYCFDYFNSNNLLYDEKKQDINVIDMVYGASDINYGSVLFALTNGAYSKTYYNEGYQLSNEEKRQTQKNTEIIIEKFMQALVNQGLEKEKDNCLTSYLALFMGSFLKP
ncbi:hypothetical protein IJ182_08725 [bacterium]|nr:hypothetical protein [bacterium]